MLASKIRKNNYTVGNGRRSRKYFFDQLSRLLSKLAHGDLTSAGLLAVSGGKQKYRELIDGRAVDASADAIFSDPCRLFRSSIAQTTLDRLIWKIARRIMGLVTLILKYSSRFIVRSLHASGINNP